VLYLIGWGNRIGTIYTWARALTFSRNRGHRLITFDDARGFGTADAPSDTRPADASTPTAAPPGDARDGGSSAPDNARDVDPAAARRVSPEGAPAGAPPSAPDR
jgi:NADH dehydrogenase